MASIVAITASPGAFAQWQPMERHPKQQDHGWDEETGAVSLLRKASNNANGNLRDHQGRLLTIRGVLSIYPLFVNTHGPPGD